MNEFKVFERTKMDFDQWLKEVSRGMALPRDESPKGPGGSCEFEADPEEETSSTLQEDGD